MPFLIRQGDAWHFRRRVPKGLRDRLKISEIYRALGTVCKKEAKRRAAILFVQTEGLFQQMADQSDDLTDAEILGAVRYWLDNNGVWKRRKEWLRSIAPNYFFHNKEEVFDTMTDATITLDGAGSPEDEKYLQAVSVLNSADGPHGFHYWQSKEDLARVNETLMAEMRKVVDARFDELFSKTPLASAPAEKKSPLFSTNTSTYLDEKPYSSQVRHQNEVTFRLWVELMEDLPCSAYTGADADKFRRLLLELPASHGKGGKIHAKEAISKAAADRTIPRLTMKTVKRHFSALSQYWIWLTPREYVDRNIFQGFSFPGTRSKVSKRGVWSASDLRRLFTDPGWQSARHDTAWHWLPLVCLHSGLRLEEASRLRPIDVEHLYGEWCFRIRPHPDGWKPKSEAGTREVPIHSWLVKRGFLKLVERRRKENAARIFSELQHTGRDRRLGTEFSREFSKFIRDKIGLAESVTFHSFRHTFRSGLAATTHQQRHITRLGGWESEYSDEGTRTYEHMTPELMPFLKAVVEDFKPPIDIDKLLK